MKLYCVYSEQFVPLYKRFFEPSLRAVSPELEIISDVFQVGGNGDFRTAGFNQALIYKWKRGLEALYESPNQVILFTDIDIIFNKPLVPAIMAWLDDDGDLAVTPDRPGDFRKWGYNVGVLALRSNPAVRRLVSRILDEMILRGQWDQHTFNVLLPKAELKVRILPFTFANGRIPYDQNSILYHATCTSPRQGKSSLEMKIEGLTKAESFFAARGKGSSSANIADPAQGLDL